MTNNDVAFSLTSAALVSRLSSGCNQRSSSKPTRCNGAFPSDRGIIVRVSRCGCTETTVVAVQQQLLHCQGLKFHRQELRASRRRRTEEKKEEERVAERPCVCACSTKFSCVRLEIRKPPTNEIKPTPGENSESKGRKKHHLILKITKLTSETNIRKPIYF